MAGNDQTQIRVAGDGHLFVAPVDSPAPVDATTALDAAWIDLGFVSPDGAEFRLGVDVVDIRVWQSFYIQRKIVTGRDAVLAFALSQWFPETVQLAFGGGTYEDVGGGTLYHPPTPETLDERALVLETLDGDRAMRIYIPKGLVASGVTTSFSRADASLLPIEFTATPTGADDPWTAIWDDDDADFAAAS